MAWIKIGENIYQDTKTGAIGELRRNSGGGLFVADKGRYTGKYKKDTTPSYKKDTEVNKEINRNYNIASEYDKEAYELELKQRKEGRENGELTQKYRELEDLHKHKQNMAEDYRSYARKLENSRQRQTLNNEFGIGVKEEQLKNLKTAGNITKTPEKQTDGYSGNYNKQSMIEAQNKIHKQFKNEGLLDEDEYYSRIGKEYAKIENRAYDDIDIRQQRRAIIKELKENNSYNKFVKKLEDKEFTYKQIDENKNPLFDHKKLSNMTWDEVVQKNTDYYNESSVYDFDGIRKGKYKYEEGWRDNKAGGVIKQTDLDKLISKDEWKNAQKDISPMSEYSDTTGTGLSDKQHTTLSKMSLSELRKTAQEYNIDTTGLSKQKLIAKLIAIFK